MIFESINDNRKRLAFSVFILYFLLKDFFEPVESQLLMVVKSIWLLLFKANKFYKSGSYFV